MRWAAQESRVQSTHPPTLALSLTDASAQCACRYPASSSTLRPQQRSAAVQPVDGLTVKCESGHTKLRDILGAEPTDCPPRTRLTGSWLGAWAGRTYGHQMQLRIVRIACQQHETGATVERNQHTVQDAAEHYAVFVMQRTAEELGVAGANSAEPLWQKFREYLDGVGMTLGRFESGEYKKYKRNVDHQIPRFVARLAERFTGDRLAFWIDEANQRNLGKKADFFVSVGRNRSAIPVSLKNYIGGGGITRPQVGSSTFLAFANRFVFERTGVGKYIDPRVPGATFTGSSNVRDDILAFEGRYDLIAPLQFLQDLNQSMRDALLQHRFFDKDAFDRERDRIAIPGIRTVLDIFEILGVEEVVREKFLSLIGMDGKEEALFFDDERYVDSITDQAYHDLRVSLNSPATVFEVCEHKQNLRFSFGRGNDSLLSVDVPFTINTNGAWWRDIPYFEGVRVKRDKGHDVELRWGELRPYKSRELATSTNTYLNLKSVGIFGH